MKTRLTLVAFAAGLTLGLPAARAQDQSTLTADDFQLTVAGSTDGGSLSKASCACPFNITVGLAISTAGAAKLTSSDSLKATLMLGQGCDQTQDPSICKQVGQTILTLSASSTSDNETLSTADLFNNLPTGAGCDAATSTSLWAIIRDNGTLVASPLVPISFGGTAPSPPSGVAALTADSGLAVSWKTPADTSSLQGYQVLCMPGPAASAPAPAFEICAAAPPDTGDGPFASLDASFVCSGLISLASTSTRVGGLTNGTAYQVAVISIGIDGTPSAPSDPVTQTPAPTLGFDDLYKMSGGTAQTGCSVAGGRRGGGRQSAAGGLIVAILLVAGLFRGAGRRRARARRRHGAGWGSAIAVVLTLGALLALPGRARAADDDNPDEHGSHGFVPGLTMEPIAPRRPSPRNWNLELRFGPYRPDVDSEFADRGQPDRPYEETFSSSRHLMSALELDRQIVHRGGTWSVGFGYGFYRVSAASLAADHVTRTGDQTALRVMPFSLMAVYRADILRERGVPLVPYGKLGLDCAFWSISDTAKTSTMDGQTFGWHAGVGISLDLSFLDPEAARMMDIETGVNEFAIFFEYDRYKMDGFGSSTVLRVGDTTWFAGAMLEF